MDETPRRRRPHAAGPPTVLLALTAALAVFACGDGSGSSADAAAAGGSSGASSPASGSAGSFEPVRRPGEPLPEATRAALDEVRAAVDPYRTPDGALEDGYVLFSAPPSGTRIAYIDSAAVGPDGASELDQELEPTRPEILIYRRVDVAGSGDGGGASAGEASGDGGEAGPAGGASAWRLAAVEYAMPKTEAGSTRPDEALDLFPGLRAGDWREYPTREALGMNVKWTGYGGCHYEGGAELVLVGGPGHTYLRLPPGAVTGESWSGPPVTPDACAPTYQGQELLVAHSRLWMLRAWIAFENPDGVFRPTNPRLEG